MPDLKLIRISYKELKEKPIEVKDDRYSIAAFFTENIRQTFLTCPGVKSESDCAVLLLFDGDIAIGREIRFGTRLKIGDDIIWVHTGCCLMVCEEYRKIGAGVIIMTANINKDDPVGFGAFFTPTRVKLLKKQKVAYFEIPEYIKLSNTRFLFESFWGFKGWILTVSSAIGNAGLRVLEIPNIIRKRKLLKKFVVKKEVVVPDWAGELATNDGHKYMEYHDTKWLQWNLDHNLKGFPQDKQSFYTVYDKNSKPMGFFMTKERYEEEAGRYKNIVRGTIVEWATLNEMILSEADLNLLAISTFSSNVSHITTVTDNPETGKKIKKMGFRDHGTFQMSFSDKTGSYADGTDLSNWRIRCGCSNSIIY